MNSLKKLDRIASDIKTMKIRGAGRIAGCAVSTLSMVAKESKAKNEEIFLKELNTASKRLLSTRPTAISLANGIRYLMHRINDAKSKGADLESLRSTAITTAQYFLKESNQALSRIGEIGSKRIKDNDVLMTHCQSNAVVAIMREARKNGKKFSVYVTETRPRYQGRKTATLLAKEGIPVKIIVDSAARYFMNEIDKVIVGADAISANGAVINKIGTATIATCAHEARTQFIVASETYKFSPETAAGELVTIEERDAAEILPKTFLQRFPKISVKNPAFDITPPEYIDLIITERGVIPPQSAIMIIHELFGSISPNELLEYQTYKVTED